VEASAAAGIKYAIEDSFEGALMKFCIVPFAVATLTSACITVNVPAKGTADGGTAKGTADGGTAKGTADGSSICVFPQPGGGRFCQASTNLTANQVTNQTSLCTSMQGTIVAACPVGAVGCCATTSGSVDFDQCFYGVSAAVEENMCATNNGIWAAGSATSDAGATDDATEGSATSDAGATDDATEGSATSDAGATDDATD
jgi:hypothetical protein